MTKPPSKKVDFIRSMLLRTVLFLRLAQVKQQVCDTEHTKKKKLVN